MKKIALISTFCDTDEKIDILIENIIILKKLNLDVFVITPIILPNKVLEFSDFVFYTKENPILNWPLRAFTWWRKVNIDDKTITMHRTVDDYGWAALYQVKKMSQIALTYDYDIFYHMIYDLEIDDEIIGEINRNEVNIIHPRVNPKAHNDVWEATLHFMSFDRNVMNQIESRIDINHYINSNLFAEGHASEWANQIPLEIKKHPVKDKIYFFEGKDLLNLVENRDYKLFFNKSNEEGNINFKLCIYDIKVKQNVKILVNDELFDLDLDNNILIEFKADSLNINTLFVIDNKGLINLTDEWIKTTRNLIYVD